MTNIEELEATFKSLGIEYVKYTEEEYHLNGLSCVIQLNKGKPNIISNFEYGVMFGFDKEGKFVNYILA